MHGTCLPPFFDPLLMVIIIIISSRAHRFATAATEIIIMGIGFDSGARAGCDSTNLFAYYRLGLSISDWGFSDNLCASGVKSSATAVKFILKSSFISADI